VGKSAHSAATCLTAWPGLPDARAHGAPASRSGRAFLCCWSSHRWRRRGSPPFDPTRQQLDEDLRRPTLEHPLGQDKLGRDQLSRVIYGARVSLQVGIATVVVTATIGVLVGAIAGYAGGAIDFWAMRIVDVLLAFPGILLAIAMSAVLGPSLRNVVIALGAIGWTGYARLVRGEVLALKQREHVQAALALGVPRGRVLARHILPLLAAPVVVQATFGMAAAIVAEASLSFLGLGVQPPTPSWGAMINDGRTFLLVAPHLTLWPGLAIFTTVLGLNFLGDGLRDVLDVRAR
jgi:peptide/nickel transport system permease protein